MRQALFLSIALLVASTSLQAAESEFALQAKAVNRAAIENLGVSVNALALLLQTTDGSFMPKWSMESDGSWKLTQELKTAGLVDVRLVQGLPNGTLADQEFVNLSRTAKGSAIAAAFRQ
jgi:hypothetical protein